MKRLTIIENDLNLLRTLFNYISNKVSKLQSYRLFIKEDELLDILDQINNDDIILLNIDTATTNSMKIINKFNSNPYIIAISQNLKLIKELKKYSKNIYIIFSKVKWSIEKCIEGLYKTTDISILNNYFFLKPHQKITPKIFISTVVDKLSYDL